MKIDAVFSGGGVKAFAFIGCLQSLSAHNFTLERVAGTSAGAIFASLIAAGYEAEEINEQLAILNLQNLLDPPSLTTYLPFTKWFYLYFQMGLNKGEKLEQWIAELLARKGVYTFKDLPSSYLKIIATDLTYSRLVVIPDDLQRFYEITPENFPIATAVRMSAGFPYFFVPKRIKTENNEICLFVGGGLVSNFPLWVFENESGRKKRPILGMKLSETTGPLRKQQINNSFSLLQAMLTTMKQAHDHRYIFKTHEQNIIYISTPNISSIDLMISETTRHELIESGKASTNKFLKRWPN